MPAVPRAVLALWVPFLLELGSEPELGRGEGEDGLQGEVLTCVSSWARGGQSASRCPDRTRQTGRGTQRDPSFYHKTFLERSCAGTTETGTLGRPLPWESGSSEAKDKCQGRRNWPKVMQENKENLNSHVSRKNIIT